MDSHSLTHAQTQKLQGKIQSPDMQTWPWSWSDVRLADIVLSPNVSRIWDQQSPLRHIQLQYRSITKLPTSLIPHYRRSTWLRLRHSALKVWPHIRSSLVDCPVAYCLQMCSNMISTIADIFFYPICLVSIWPSCTARVHGSCTHTQL